MTKYLPKAERMFQQKLKTALAPTGYIHDLGGSWDVLKDDGEIMIRHWRTDSFDFNYISELFRQYGNYLLLIEDDRDVQGKTVSD